MRAWVVEERGRGRGREREKGMLKKRQEELHVAVMTVECVDVGVWLETEVWE